MRGTIKALRHSFFIFVFLLVVRFASAQNVANQIFLQAGFTLNFLREAVSTGEYGGPLGSSTTYGVKDLKPLAGFSSAIVAHSRISQNKFFRYGALLSYHVSSLSLSEQTTEDVYGVVDVKENVFTRFRSFYLQLPLEIGGTNKNNSIGVFGGLKFGVTLVSGCIWKYIHQSWEYAVYQNGPELIDSTGPVKESNNLKQFERRTDASVEIGCVQSLSNFFYLEERFDFGLLPSLNFSGTSIGPKLKQMTLEITLGLKISKSEVK